MTSKVRKQEGEAVGGDGLDGLFDEVEGDAVDEVKADEAAAKKAGSPNRVVAVAELPPGMIEVKPHETNTRKADADVQDLKDSIAEAGIVVPLQVIKVGDSKYRLLAGSRRLKAAKALGMKTVPCVILDGEVEVVSAIENVVRREMTPLEEAAAYRMLMDEYDITQERLARLVGKTQPAVSERMSLLKAPADVKKALVEKKVSVGEVRKVVKKNAKPKSAKEIMDERHSGYAIPAVNLPAGMDVKVSGSKLSIGLTVWMQTDANVAKEIVKALKGATTKYDAKKVATYCEARAKVGKAGK